MKPFVKFLFAALASLISILVRCIIIVFLAQLFFQIQNYWISCICLILSLVCLLKFLNISTFFFPYKILKVRSWIPALVVLVPFIFLFTLNIIYPQGFNTFKMPNNAFIIVNIFFILGLLNSILHIKSHLKNLRVHD